MFDFGFGEMLLVAVVALVVLGPERLPQVARSAGLWVGRIQRFIANVKNELSQQAGMAEFQAAKNSIEQSVSQVRQEVRQQLHAAQEDVRTTAHALLPETADGDVSGSLNTPQNTGSPNTAAPLPRSGPHRFSLHNRALQHKRRIRIQSPALLRARTRRHTSRKHAL